MGKRWGGGGGGEVGGGRRGKKKEGVEKGGQGANKLYHSKYWH